MTNSQSSIDMIDMEVRVRMLERQVDKLADMILKADLAMMKANQALERVEKMESYIHTPVGIREGKDELEDSFDAAMGVGPLNPFPENPIQEREGGFTSRIVKGEGKKEEPTQ